MAGMWRLVRMLELAGYAGFMAVSFLRIPNVCSPLWLKECIANRYCGRFLREGWLGPTFDGADDQWRELRESLPLLVAAVAAHGLLSVLVRKTCPREEVQQGDAAADAQAASPPPALAYIPVGKLGRRRALLNAAVNVVFLAVLHGAHAVFPVALVCGAFAVGHTLKGTRLAQPATWVIAVGFIWLKEKWYGLLTFETVLGKGYAGLDGFRGLHPWRLSFNLAVLRIVSFNVDLHWAEMQRRRQAAGAVMPSANDDTKRTENGGRGRPKGTKDQAKEIDVHEYSSRALAHRPMADYSLWYCLCYAFYAPLYLAGPTLTFNAFVSHVSPVLKAVIPSLSATLGFLLGDLTITVLGLMLRLLQGV